MRRAEAAAGDVVEVPPCIAWVRWVFNALAGTLITVPDCKWIGWALLSLALTAARITVPVEVFTAVVL